MKIETPQQAREILGIEEKETMTMSEHLIGIAQTMADLVDCVKDLEERVSHLERKAPIFSL